MEMKNKYNPNQIVSIKVFDKKQCMKIEYIPPKKGKWYREEVKEGFKEILVGYHIYNKEDLINGKYKDINFLVIEDKVYYKPKVLINLSNLEELNYEFDLLEDAIEFAKNVSEKTNINWIEL